MNIKKKSTKRIVKDFKNKYFRTDYLRGNFKFIIDKYPENFLFIGFIKKLLPILKLYSTFRDPWDVPFHFTSKDMLQIFLTVQVFLILVFLCLILKQLIFFGKNKTNENILD